MALIRCVGHGCPAGGRYVEAPYMPYAGIGTVICGRGLCFEPGFAWLTRAEAREHANRNRRMFLFPSSAAKIAVSEQVTLNKARAMTAKWISCKSDKYQVFHDGLAPIGSLLKTE